MNTLFLCIVILLIMLAVFDLVVGVSNDAVNFLSSAMGAKVAGFRTIIVVAAIGVFLGASMSNGMMDVTRHGIMTPMYFSFSDVICVFLAVMLTDIVLLDVFNSLGLPTSTTVSMTFELLGGAFAIALISIISGGLSPEGELLTLGDLLNTEKAISVILGIFLSVAIAFVLGTIVQWLARLIFSFNNKKRNALKNGILSGISITVIIWFLLINGLKGSSLMTPELKQMINTYTWGIIAIGIIGFSFIMTILSLFKVRVLKFVVLLGTMSLAMAFASNDLVNFIGVPLTGLDAFQDYSLNGNGDSSGFLMSSLMDNARTPWIYLFIAGIIMVLSLVFSKKARSVVRTSIDLSRQDEGDEMLGSSAIARGLVRFFHNVATYIVHVVPSPIGKWVDARFNSDEAVMPSGAAFDEVRAVVNLVLASLLVALGTSLKLPLSTTYVTFMVAMGSSLADRAWSRESAVFRITGVLSVIGGWFITAGAAFFFCYLLTNILHFGGFIAMLLASILAIIIVIRSNLSYKPKKEDTNTSFNRLMRSKNELESWTLLTEHVKGMCSSHLQFIAENYDTCIKAFFHEEYRPLKHVASDIEDERKEFKRERRRGILGLRRINPLLAIERNTWYFHTSNALSEMIHSLERIVEPCKEHVGNNFSPVPTEYAKEFLTYEEEILKLINQYKELLVSGDLSDVTAYRSEADKLRRSLSAYRKEIIDYMQLNNANIEAMSVLLNMVQESEEILSGMRHAVRGVNHFLAS